MDQHMQKFGDVENSQIIEISHQHNNLEIPAEFLVSSSSQPGISGNSQQIHNHQPQDQQEQINESSSSVQLSPNILMRKKYTELHINLKLALINDHEINKFSQRSLAEKYNVSKTAVQRILSQKQEIRKFASSSDTLKRKRQVVYSDIDFHVLEWFKSSRRKKIPISGPRLQAKSLEIAKTLNIENFTGSNGWLNRFKKRNIKTVSRDLETVDESTEEQVRSWLSNVNQIVCGYSPENIYSFDETNLYYRNVVPRASGFQIEKGSGKERLTVCFLANSFGSKEFPLVIGRNKNPSCFKNVDVESVFNIIWRADIYGGLKYEFFEEYLLRFDENLRYQNRSVILLLDNTITCELDLQFKLTNIKLEFIPGRITSRVAPLHLGIFRTFKHFYRNEGMLYLSATCSDPNNILTEDEILKRINVFDACNWIQKAWQNLAPIIFQSCFKKAGLLSNQLELEFDGSFIDGFSSSSEEEENFVSCTEANTSKSEEIDPNYEITFYHHIEKNKSKKSRPKKVLPVNHDDALKQLLNIKKLAESSKGSIALSKHIDDSIVELKKIIEDRKHGRQTKITDFFGGRRRQNKSVI